MTHRVSFRSRHKIPRALLLPFLFCCFFPLLSCFVPASEPLEENEMVGEYWSDDIGRNDILRLSDDHTFTQIYVDTGGDTVSNSGTWEFYEWSNHRTYSVECTGYRLLNPEWIRSTSWMHWGSLSMYSLNARKDDGKISLLLTQDIPLIYVKID